MTELTLRAMGGADRSGGAVLGGVQRAIQRLEMGVERDRSGCKLRDTDVADGGDAGAGTVHVRHRTVEGGPIMVREGPP